MIIYKLTNLITNMSYVGQTKYKLENRFAGHVRNAIERNSSLYLHNAIRKYGVENFSKEVLYSAATHEELDFLEEKAIIEQNTLWPNGYNLKHGGQNKTFSEALRLKMAGENHPFFGKHHTKETKEKIRKSLSGKVGANKGKSVSERTKNKISISLRGRKRGPRTNEVKEKIRKSLSGRKLSVEHNNKIKTKFKRGNIPWNKNKKLSDEHKQRLSEAHKQFNPSEETRKKLSEKAKQQWRIYNEIKRYNKWIRIVSGWDFSGTIKIT